VTYYTMVRTSLFSLRPPPPPTLLPYTTLFRSTPSASSRCSSASTPSTSTRAPASGWRSASARSSVTAARSRWSLHRARGRPSPRSEEHTSELQSRGHLVCRLLLEKKHVLAHAV